MRHLSSRCYISGMTDAPPRRADGFRDRGRETTRLEAFVDAAFAFAVTLLVISVDAVPDSVEALLAAMKGIPAFLASFMLVALFWYAHNKWSRRFGLDDGASTFLSLALVFLVLVYVYPLKMLFGSFFNFVTNGAVPAGFIVRSARDVLAMFAIYAAAWSTMGVIIMLLYWRAWRARTRIGLDRDEAIRTYAEIWTWSMVPITGVVSLVAIVLMPAGAKPWQVAIPGMVYFLMSLSGVAYWLGERRARRLLPDAGARA